MVVANPYESSKYPALSSAWDYSVRKLDDLKSTLHLTNADSESCIAVVGSFGRNEASSCSDLDYILLSESDSEYDRLNSELHSITLEKGIAFSNANGVFSKRVTPLELTNIAGAKEEALHQLAQRILLLLESKPIYNESYFEKIREEILGKYLEYLNDDSDKFPVYLLNDTIRYFRWICVNLQFYFWAENEKWTIRNIKLRHSRIVMYAGMLLVLLNSSNKTNKRDYIESMLPMTPLERIASVFNDNGHSAEKILEAYDFFLSLLRNQTVRDALQVDYKERYNNCYYDRLKTNSDELQQTLSNFIFDMRGKWKDEAMEYLIF